MTLKNTLILVLLFGLNFSYGLKRKLEFFTTDIKGPTSIKNSGNGRLFLSNQAGLLKIVISNGTLETEQFLDMVSRVKITGYVQGLFGLGFHPNYTNKGYFFVNSNTITLTQSIRHHS